MDLGKNLWDVMTAREITLLFQGVVSLHLGGYFTELLSSVVISLIHLVINLCFTLRVLGILSLKNGLPCLVSPPNSTELASVPGNRLC
jgi:hypothetical protein